MKSRRTVFVSTFIAALGGLLFGFDTAVISGTTESLVTAYGAQFPTETWFFETFGWSDGEFWKGFTVAIALIGTVVGAFAVGKPGDIYGRKRTLFVLAVFYFISALGSALAPEWYSFLIFRFLGGLAVGGSSVIAPMYIAEISPGRMRGRLVAINQLNVVGGILLAFVSNYLVSQIVSGDSDWRWMLGVEAVPAALFFVLLFKIPYSPRWLAKQGRWDESRAVLDALGEEDVDGELREIRASLKGEVKSKAEPLFQKQFSKPIFLAWAVAMFNQLSGINALMYYAPDIFRLAGSGEEDALMQSIAVGGTNFMFTFIALAIIDKFGRRPLMITGSLGTALCLGLVAFAFFSAGGDLAAEGASVNGALVLVGLLGFIAFFAFSQGAVIWVFISEIFPNRVRSKGQALGSFTHWFMAAVVSLSFPVIASISGGYAFAFFSAMMLLQLFFALVIMPETKGLSLEELEYKLGIGTKELEELEHERESKHGSRSES